MTNKSLLPSTLDDLFSTTHLGSFNRAIADNVYGIDPLQNNGKVQDNKEHQGYTFVVRPQLNLQADNIRNVRTLSNLMTDNNLTMARYVRCMLDPRLGTDYKNARETVKAIGSPLLDNNNAFISILTNNVTSVSGWPDSITPTFKSNSGLYNEVYMQVDGITVNYENYTIDYTIRNTMMDPVPLMLHTWQTYMSSVFEGLLMPYPDYIANVRLDYNTRIYRLVMNQDRETVSKLAATGVAIPISNPTGSFFDFNSETPFNDQVKNYTIRFEALGFIVFDDILIKQFNLTVVAFNPAMADGVREKHLVAVEKDLWYLFRNRVYPRINPNNFKLEWWVPRNLYSDTAVKVYRESYNEANAIPSTL